MKGIRWNGKGIESYDYFKYIFIGEYLNGEKRGKEYYKSNFSEFDISDFDLRKNEKNEENFTKS